MLSKNFKFLIYISFVIFFLTLVIPIFSLAFHEDSIYVWSNNSSIPTTIIPNENNQNTSTTNTSR